MTIRYNKKVTAILIGLILNRLRSYNDTIKIVDVHLTEDYENDNKPPDKQCLLVARLQGKEAIAVTNNACSSQQAVYGAIDKLEKTLRLITG